MISKGLCKFLEIVKYLAIFKTNFSVYYYNLLIKNKNRNEPLIIKETSNTNCR